MMMLRLFILCFIAAVILLLMLLKVRLMMIFPWMIPTGGILIRTNKLYPFVWNNDRFRIFSKPSVDHASLFLRNEKGIVTATTTTTADTESTNVLAVNDDDDSSSKHSNLLYDTNYSHRSNSTHIVWYVQNTSYENKYTNQSNDDYTIMIQTIQEAKYDAYQFLRHHIMSFDAPFLQTMGFHDEYYYNYYNTNDDNNNNNDNNTNTDPNIDGLLNGLIGPVIDIAYRMKQRFLYTDIISKEIFLEYVINYANVNESRNNIRTVLYEQLIEPLFFMNHTTTNTTNIDYTMADVVRIINTNMWRMLAPSHGNNENCIYFKSSQTPIIFDPMSVLVFGYGSCTGISILFVQALRTAGIPVRLTGTNAWNQNILHGNHNWIEIYIPNPSKAITITGVSIPGNYTIHNDNDDNDDGTWIFIEGSPTAKSSDVNTIDDWDPCRYWICSSDRLMNQTQFYAAKLVMNTSDTTITYFPLAWDTNNTAVPARNRTLFYHTICAQCQYLKKLN
jgi:Transglutaminase-like superfamily